MTDWDPKEHPRNPDDGRFVEKRAGEGWIQRLSEQIEPAIRYFHGTVAEDLDEILPADRHGRGVVFPFMTDRSYAYASTEEEIARTWAIAAHAAGDAGTLPRVYEVEPLDPSDVEEDPTIDEYGRGRINHDEDRRSRTGWRVIREMPWPEEWGDPEDWR